MNRTLFTSFACVPLAIGAIAALAPSVLLGSMKGAEVTPAAEVMARTAGVLLVAIGALNLAVRHHPPSATLRAVVAFDLSIQLLLLPIDPLAWAAGTFTTLGSFVPNTALHLVLAAVFTKWLVVDLREPSHRPTLG
ncbi:MAG: hypothetical protein ABMA64_01470 [Myxococcota bacterium]